MLLRSFKITLILAIIWSFTGCELYYLPPQIQTPSHTQKGDVSINVQGLYTGSASASYAFNDNGFIGASYMGYAANNADSFSNDFFRVSTLEGGYFTYDSTSNIHFQISGGLGAGSVGDPSTGFQADFNRLYIQPSIGFFSVRKNFENHLTMRISSISYLRQELQNVDPFSVQFIEPAYTFRAGSENIKFHMQLGFSIPFSTIETRPIDFFHDPFIFGLGVQANFNVFQNNR